jgi:hypothetical protein
MSRRHLYLICSSLIASSPATSALAHAYPASCANTHLLTRPTNFTPLLRYAGATIECLQYCSKTWGCPGAGCGASNRAEYDKCVEACG